ncbi:hypothetical protein RRG08_021284 [Elysia crispata]|uniref:Uncharacterized protein n=1 Tax=Elysia crispata TaxID=231223 RepID=A0AAE0ZA95_9GAST|nr:hypothetical protein RRG08_021284 [Elysia crispata]
MLEKQLSNAVLCERFSLYEGTLFSNLYPPTSKLNLGHESGVRWSTWRANTSVALLNIEHREVPLKGSEGPPGGGQS